jgi:hypothetical protein
MTATDYRMTRRNIFIGAAASLMCAPSIVRAAKSNAGARLAITVSKSGVFKSVGTILPK